MDCAVGWILRFESRVYDKLIELLVDPLRTADIELPPGELNKPIICVTIK
jgi:hypothetical protein